MCVSVSCTVSPTWAAEKSILVRGTLFSSAINDTFLWPHLFELFAPFPVLLLTFLVTSFFFPPIYVGCIKCTPVSATLSVSLNLQTPHLLTHTVSSSLPLFPAPSSSHLSIPFLTCQLSESLKASSDPLQIQIP